MINDIQEDYVSFEVAKLLKEKGMYVDPVTNTKYGHPVLIHRIKGIKTCNIDLWNNGFGGSLKTEKQKWIDGDDDYIDYAQQITIQLAVKWIYENFGIWISVDSYYNSFKLDKLLFEYGISHKDNSWEGLIENASNRLNNDWALNPQKYNLFDTPQEAYQSAIKYTLENLIP